MCVCVDRERERHRMKILSPNNYVCVFIMLFLLKQSHKFNSIYAMHKGENGGKIEEKKTKPTLIKTLHRLIILTSNMNSCVSGTIGPMIITFVIKQELCY